MDTKQVIVIRRDLYKGKNSVRTGKLMAQCCHASLGSLLKFFDKKKCIDENNNFTTRYEVEFEADSILDDWLNNKFTKIVVYVPSEKELIELEQKCFDLDIPCCLIKDCGLTEFHGIPTITCLGIGPWESKSINQITGNLPLL